MISRYHEGRRAHLGEARVHEGKCSAANGLKSAPPLPVVAKTPALIRESDISSPGSPWVSRTRAPSACSPSGLPRSVRGDTASIEASTETGDGGFKVIKLVEDALHVLNSETPDPWRTGIFRRKVQRPRVKMGRLNDHEAVSAQ